MWRKNQVCCCALVSFGLGLLVGMCLESSFFGFLAGMTVISLGLWCGCKK